MDVDDIHGVAWQGVHSGCLAGGYLAVIYGIFGLSVKDGVLCLNPVRTLFDGVTAHFVYKGTKITLSMKNGELTVKKKGAGNIKIRMPNGKDRTIKGTLVYNM